MPIEKLQMARKASFKHHKIPKRYELPSLIATETLETCDLVPAVKLPAGQSLEDWLALNAIEFFNSIAILFAPISRYCTKDTCPKMSAGPGFEYVWQDNKKSKKQTSMPANEYITHVMIWVEEFIDDPIVFPEEESTPFPKDFRQIIANIFRRMFRVYAHVYHHHQKDIKAENLAAQLNTSFRHFYLFTKEFNLIPDDQRQPLAAIIRSFQ
jgi:MOB kinase activator 1